MYYYNSIFLLTLYLPEPRIYTCSKQKPLQHNQFQVLLHGLLLLVYFKSAALAFSGFFLLLVNLTSKEIIHRYTQGHNA